MSRSVFDLQIQPMLIGLSGDAFDSPDYLFELKLDGERCLAFIQGKRVELRNKRNNRLLPKFPELAIIYEQVEVPCILDGELIVSLDGRPDFPELQRRIFLSNSFKVGLASRKSPATLVVFDILYLGDRKLTGLPLTERKGILGDTVRETERMALSRYVEKSGWALYRLAEQRNLEGIIAKRQDSIYVPGKRTRDWIKIKNLQDDDYVICGYIFKQNYVLSLVLAQYDDQRALIYCGHVNLGINNHFFKRIQLCPTRESSAIVRLPSGHESAVWLEPELVCTVSYLLKTAGAKMRHPVFKSLRDDLDPLECRFQASPKL